MSNGETLWQELIRIVYEYQASSGNERDQAWHTLADFTNENWIAIAGALEFVAMHATHEQRANK